MTAVSYILGALAGYLIGGINPAYLIGRIKGFDIRKRGSGNAGASNAVITMGAAVGVFSALFDIFKAFLSVYLAGAVLFPRLPSAPGLRADWLCAVVGCACILGHVFPVYMKFRGGKGLACIAGVILAFDWRVFLIMLGAEAVLLFLTRYICTVPITVSVAFPIVYGVMRADAVGAAVYAVASLVILWRHVENIRRILKGTELKISYLWKKKESVEALKEHLAENTGSVPDENGDEVPESLLK